ncbi:catechol 1,2-dioxygenase [Azospirillum lipoferum]|uniref:catechol 1,2-dioxygenase n=1 Tax=Azospirillum lipoferum TaxID=193 RepID=A0A5A9GMT1_AZOLI|nr:MULTISPECIES: catechol 1,2-dioxygenase [Azospirillum]KAA0595683.1 catechol 1,2-dioxygenase [Azospirillum lipoferum]MCP1611453.1 catechol 1,2-dioxygenase [Azospirillum lipoferum]MDW5537255.1 catechol 1,2-dioxygenase [Azospirillum sp. NL1]
MQAKEIDALLARFTQVTPGKTPNPRVKAIVDRIVRDLFVTMNEFDVTPDEFWTACNYLTELGKNNEAGLLAPGLGFEHFIDLLVEERESAAGLNENGTPRTIEGPLYVAGAPVHQGSARIDDGLDSEAEPLFMSGVVRDASGKPIPNAVVEVWHANSKGNYSIFDSSQTPFNNRGTIQTGADGRYSFQSIMPSGYACPPGSSTLQLLDLLGRHGARPAHIHFFVSAPGYRKLTTQINIQGDPLIDDDFAFATRDGLVPEIRRIDDPAALEARGVTRPFAEIGFDFRLVEARDGLPADVVERARVSA